MRLNFLVIGCLCFKSQFKIFRLTIVLTPRTDIVNQLASFTTVKRRKSLIKSPRNLLKGLQKINPASKLHEVKFGDLRKEMLYASEGRHFYNISHTTAKHI